MNQLFNICKTVKGSINRVTEDVFTSIKNNGILNQNILPTKRGSKGIAKRRIPVIISECETFWGHRSSRNPYMESVNNLNTHNRQEVFHSNRLNAQSIQDFDINRKSVNFNNLINVDLEAKRKFKTPEEKVSLLLLNTQSLKNKDSDVRIAIEEYKADVTILTETWLSDSDVIWTEACELNNNGLKMEVVNRKGRQGGGLAIVYKSNVKVKKGRCGATRSFEYASWKIYFKNISTVILAIYRPPYSGVNQVTAKMFLDDFSEFLPIFLTEEKNVIAMGDFNLHINNAKDRNAQSFLEFTESLGLKQHVATSTHRAGNILDHIYTEIGGNIKVSECTNRDFVSDHCIIHSVLEIPKDNITQKTITYRKYADIDRTVFAADLQFEHSGIENVNDLVSKFEETARAALDQHAPERTKTVTVRGKNPWFTLEVKQQKSTVRKHERLWRKSRSEHHWKVLQTERRLYRDLIRRTKVAVLSSKVLECKGDTKKLYQLFNSISGKKSDNPMPENQSDQDLADNFADYFMSKIQNIRDSLQNVPAYAPSPSCEYRLVQFKPLEPAQVKKIISSLATKSCELDIMPSKLLKEVLPEILPIITRIVNLSLVNGVFTDSWKVAIIRPLIKKLGLELISSNYRPVSNLSFLSKVLEKAALQQFMQYSDHHKLMPDYQSAYRANFSCETALVKLMDDLLWSMEHQRVTTLMAIDLSAAFDTVDHDVLLSVLNAKFGVTGNALRWFESYLRPRSCKVSVRSAYSEVKDLQFSVPQGSCAGPVLYLAYASTMQEVVPQNIAIHGYADDHAIKVTFNPSDRLDETSAMKNIEKCAADIKVWMDKNRLRMNSAKTEFIIFGSNKHLDKCTTTRLDVNGEYVGLSQEIKYLGVYLDSHLTLKHHITLKCRTAMWNIQRIKLMRNFLTKDACETLILGLVISHLDYANALYVGLPDCDVKKLQRVQNISAKLVLKTKDSSLACLKRLHWLPVHLRIKHKVLTLLFKSLRGESPNYLRDLVKLHSPARHGLRSESIYQKLTIPFSRRKTFANRAYSTVAPIWWNDLPNQIKKSDTTDIFKAKLKTLLFDQF